MVQGINPVTIRGQVSSALADPSNLTVGRLWLSDTSAAAKVGQHRHQTGMKQPTSFTKWMQFCLWTQENEAGISGIMLSDEDLFLQGFAELQKKNGVFVISGIERISRSASVPEKGRSVEFQRYGLDGFEWVKVIMREHEKPPSMTHNQIITERPEGKILGEMTCAHDLLTRGLSHLFTNGELE